MGPLELKKMLKDEKKVLNVLGLILANEYIDKNPDLCNKCILMYNNYSNLQTERNIIIDEKEYQLRKNQILNALLHYIDALPPELEFKKPRAEAGQQLVTLELDRALKEFSHEFKENLRKQVAQFTGISPEQVVIVGIREGSLIIRAILPNKAAFYLLHAFRKNPAHQFFKSLKAQSVRVVYASPLGYLAHLWYLIRHQARYRNAGFIIAALLLLATVSYGVWDMIDGQKEAAMNGLELVRTKAIESGKRVIQENNELLELVSAAQDISNAANLGLSTIQAAPDSTGPRAGESYLELLPFIRDFDQKAQAINEKIKSLNAAVETFEKDVEILILAAAHSSKNAQTIETIRAAQEEARRNLLEMNQKIQLLKGGSTLMRIIIQAVENQNQDPKLEELKYACNTAMEHLNAMETVRVI